MIAEDEVTYDREAIVKHLKDNDEKLPGNNESSCAENLMSNVTVCKIIVKFATNDPVFKASSASVIISQIGNSLQDPCKGSAKDDADLPALESDSNSYFDSSSKSDSDNVSPKLSALIQNRTTQVIPR